MSPSPAQAIVLAFLAAIVVGSLFLALPAAHAPGRSVSILDAIFTATSAVCVTGLSVVDIGSQFSRFGQTVILLLIKAGGLGILSLGALLALATGRTLGFRQRLQLQAEAGHNQVGGIVRLMRRLIVFTTGIELLGALVLYLRFRIDEGPLGGMFYALFHSVSAFNNAGFGLYADNLSRYATDPLISLDISSLHTGTLMFIVLLMFIGGNPGSTAGGVKTTTFAVLVASAWAVARGGIHPVMFGRRIDTELVTRAAVVSTMAVLSLGAALTLLTFTEPELDLLPLLFEAVSAFATVGLSLGATTELSVPGRWIIIALMFLGRIGLVTFALAVAERREEPALRYPQGEIIIG